MTEAAVIQPQDETGEEEHPDQLAKYVTFTLGDETFAVGAESVNEVLRYTEITPVPGAPDYVLGIINLRGDVVTIVDARNVFGLPAREADGQSRIIVVEIEDYAVGVLVDRVAAVTDLKASAIETSPNTGHETATEFIQGVYHDEEQLLILVDFGQLATA